MVEFIKMVAAMRRAQKDLKKKGGTKRSRECRRLERIVDQKIRSFKYTQLELFDY
ncbi:hypothetical protein [Coprobacter fastidiosus]|uniref:hypothetical protein n=1 Tax=Coprobacter fastidiosus TaxID=1099853 RepID=UPI0026772380|nr:hypothetical protein [Coprobacter fastidiosus]